MTTATQLPDADLIVACDGVNSRIQQDAKGINTEVQVGRNKYIWLGTDKVFDSFVFPFIQTYSGWIWAHAYGVDPDSSTFIVECSAETWRGLGFDMMPPDDCLGVLEKIFGRQLDGPDGWDRRSSRSTAAFGVRRYVAIMRYPQEPVDGR